MVKKKGKSKRTSLQQKYKIQKRVKEHHRKQKKEARRNPMKHRKVKDPGIPNSMPFKEQVLAEIEHAKRRLEASKVAAKEKRRAELMKRRGLTPDGQTLEDLVEGAEKSQDEFNKAEASRAKDEYKKVDDVMQHGRQSRRAYFKELKKVVETADVILEVLDARDPLGSRAGAVEEAVLARPDKKMVLVLNKVDLVPKEVVAKWLKHLRRSFPALAFKASTQENASSIKQTQGSADKATDGMLGHSGAVGTEALMGVLKNYCRSLNLKTAITVGVIGYPNVGKSSLINSLKRSKAVGVSATPGFTKSMQEIHLDKTVKLLDCPGIVFDDKDAGATLLKNCVDAEAMEDPTTAVDGVLHRCAPEQLMQVYAIQQFDPMNTPGFLALVARKNGKLRKGGIPDRIAAARMVLRDWNAGRVPFYTLPPEEEERGGGAAAAAAAEAMFVEGFGKEFDVEAEAGDAKVLEAIPDRDPLDFVTVKGTGVSQGGWVEDPDAMEEEEDAMEGNEDEDDDEDEEEGSDEGEYGGEEDSDEDKDEDADDQSFSNGQDRRDSAAERASKGAASATTPRQVLDAMLAAEREINPQVNRSLKKARKAQEKKRRRESRQGAGTEYSFERDFYGGGGGDEEEEEEEEEDDDL